MVNVDETLFRPPTGRWQPVSPRLRTARRIGLLVPAGLLAAGLVVLAVIGAPRWWLVAGVVALGGFLVWGWWWTDRVVRRWGYAEQDQDLAITSGALVRRLVVVPYGRMQYVDVQSGPLDRMLGIATVQLHTASPGTTAVIPGLEAAEAARLRDRLTALGQSEAAGL